MAFEKDIEKNEGRSDRVEKIVETMVKRQFARWLVKRSKISYKPIVKFLEDKLGIEVFFFKKLMRLTNKYRTIFLNRYKRALKNKKMQELAKKYPNENVIAGFAFLAVNDKVSLKKSDIELYETFLKILHGEEV